LHAPIIDPCGKGLGGYAGLPNPATRKPFAGKMFVWRRHAGVTHPDLHIPFRSQG
jgi:hypothetical protein